MRLATAILATEAKPGDDPQAFRAAHEQRSHPGPPPLPAALRLAADVVRREVDGFPVFTFRPRGRMRALADRHLVYVHGGSYTEALLREHWEIVAALIRYTGASITVPCYPLAPEHTHEVGHAWVEGVYRELISRVAPERVVLVGDSAGGGFCLAQAMRYRDAGLPLPARVILFSPWVDLGLTHPDTPALEPRDPIQSVSGGRLSGQWWAGADPVTHPQVSPVFGDLAGLPPVDIYTGTADILLPDIRRLSQVIAAAGVPVRLVEYAGGIHVYVGATFTPEARDTFRRVAMTLATTAARTPLPERAAGVAWVALGRQVTHRLRSAPPPGPIRTARRSWWARYRRTPAGPTTTPEPSPPDRSSQP